MNKNQPSSSSSNFSISNDQAQRNLERYKASKGLVSIATLVERARLNISPHRINSIAHRVTISHS